MSSVIIYHNPRCSKSRAALALLEENGIEPKIVLYRVTPPAPAELQRLAKCLKCDAAAMMRTTDKLYSELGLDQASVSNSERLDALAKHPELLQRPIVVSGTKAVIARPPERVLELIRG